MKTYWDEFIDGLNRGELTDKTPRQLCEMFYDWLMQQLAGQDGWERVEEPDPSVEAPEMDVLTHGEHKKGEG